MFEVSIQNHQKTLSKMFGEDNKMVKGSLKKAIQQASNLMAKILPSNTIPAVPGITIPDSMSMTRAAQMKNASFAPTNMTSATKMFTNVANTSM